MRNNIFYVLKINEKLVCNGYVYFYIKIIKFISREIKDLFIFWRGVGFGLM